ncbi:DMT family transporter [Colwellia sp. 1_MG-2023]|uniref:DMT family transporter n=1 Tax=Colwellia sp. 1_MG-2023 TaxID=3062649 RepID=UPI0026E44F96|nr:DMT family transporter [Colwellia sp. 1_MG-2023]MDO6446854.1 DMT family transporter [Colwellia sp. 1_MG-2023]
MVNQSFIKTSLLSGVALMAFAANSVLCRLALGAGSIDPASFTNLRMISGAMVLLIILIFQKSEKSATSKGSWFASLALFAYAVTFSYAYLSVDTGTGALILFGTVQIAMIVISIISGERLHITEWCGAVIAFTGFAYLILPSVSSPSISGFLLMVIAGVSWALYTIFGRNSKNPLMDTTYNFIRTLPFIAIFFIITIKDINFTSEGLILALLSGGLTSGIGYTIWYIALKGLTATQAAVIQLFVPVLAAIGGVLFVAELMTLRLIISTCVVLGGILMVVLGRYYSLKRVLKST